MKGAMNLRHRVDRTSREREVSNQKVTSTFAASGRSAQSKTVTYVISVAGIERGLRGRGQGAGRGARRGVGRGTGQGAQATSQ